MFSRFSPLTLIRASQNRRLAADGQGARRSHRAPDRTRARLQLEGLEERCLLSGIAEITEFPVPSGGNAYSVAAGPDGNVWFTQLGANIGKINPTTDAIAQFQTPTADSEPFGITAGPDGNNWFTERMADKIGEINPTTDAIAEFPVPTANSFPDFSQQAPMETSGSPRAPARSG